MMLRFGAFVVIAALYFPLFVFGSDSTNDWTPAAHLALAWLLIGMPGVYPMLPWRAHWEDG